jgi:3-phenylpropionate/trans-cinnamate dioxygenase ferredoxin reductase subunit
MTDHVVVVGASLAGFRLVEALRREGYDGRISVIGAEAETPYDRPPLSKQFLVADWGEDKIALSREGLEKLDADWRLGRRAVALSPSSLELTLDDGSTVAGDAIVLATGTRARRLPFGQNLEGVLELRTVADARKLKAALESRPRVVIVGAGFIGMELAASCRQRGLDVHVVEPLEAPLVRGLGPVLGERVAQKHRAEGVVFHLGMGVEGFESSEGDGEAGRVSGVLLSTGDSLPADVVVVGIGAVPETDWLEGAGLEVDNGVLCDATGATAREGVFALGDCARWENARYPERPRFEHWTSAVEQSDVVARRIVHGEAEPFAPIPYVWTDQFDLRIAVAGEIREGDEMHVCHGSLDQDRFLVLFGREGQLVAAVGFKRPRQLLACRKKMLEGISFEAAIEELC